MARIDSVLGIVLAQGANELRVGTAREPKMLAHGTAKRFLMPSTDEETLRDLLGEILTPEREASLGERGRVELQYETESGQSFAVSLMKRTDGFDAVFLRQSTKASVTPIRAAASSLPAVPLEPRTTELPIVPTSTRPAPSTLSVAGRELCARALGMRATDLHLVDGDAPMVRADGRLQRLQEDIVDDVLDVVGLETSARAAIARGEAVELAIGIDSAWRARVHVYRTSQGTAAAVRFIGATPMTLGTLNMPISLEDLVEIPHGLVLICGATGSGKSTTLASLAQHALYKRSVALITLEDPIEYVLSAGPHSIVRQRQIGRDVNAFGSGLRDALREDPDILVVGEMRDAETVALALTAAETGHLVIATLHSGSASSAIERILDTYPADRQHQVRSQLADSLRVIVAQRLLPNARGSGRIPAIEVLRVNHAAANLIREAKLVQLTSVLQAGRREGMLQLERSLADRVNAGDVKLEDAKSAANDVDALLGYLTPRP